MQKMFFVVVNDEGLEQHLTEEYSESYVPYLCDNCSFVTNKFNKLNEHSDAKHKQ